MRPRLFIFAKAPVMGQAKTRLAADIGLTHAKRIYRAMTGKVIRKVRSPKWETLLCVTPANLIGKVPEWRGVPQIAQVEGSLTPRLEAVMSGKGPVVIIGTDCTHVCANDINTAIKALKRHTVVLGPADDGGFWLIAVNAPLPSGIFDNVRWSTAYTLTDVVKNCEGKVHFLRTLTDVDDAHALINSQFKY